MSSAACSRWLTEEPNPTCLGGLLPEWLLSAVWGRCATVSGILFAAVAVSNKRTSQTSEVRSLSTLGLVTNKNHGTKRENAIENAVSLLSQNSRL